MACEIMYLATCILTEQTSIKRITDVESYRDVKLQMQGAKKISYIRNADPMAYAYLVESFMLLQSAGYFTESII
jgi:hypothetical protein